jgi:PKD repeat protein
MKMMLSFVLLCIVTLSVTAQTVIPYEPESSELKVKSATDISLQLEAKLSDLRFNVLASDAGNFDVLSADGIVKNHSVEPGMPNLPVFSELITLPIGAEIQVTVLSYDEEYFNLNELGLDKIAPIQASYFKNTNPEDVVFAYNEAVYNTDQWIEPEIVKTEVHGMMRGLNIAQVVVNPFRYNPKTNELLVLKNIRLNLEFVGGDIEMTQSKSQAQYSPQFGAMYQGILNYQAPQNKDTYTNFPIKYVIVSDRTFETTLQPFIEWKTISGYDVIEAYTDDIGNTTGEIKSYLQALYDGGTTEDPAPSYILIVGDHSGNYSVPAFSGEAGSHVTDLYYACYDGASDNIPDAYMGRISANTTTELENALNKIIPYEKYTIPDGSYLDRCMLIAGVDGTFAPKHGDGTISYGIREYFNEAHDFTDIFAYYYSYTSGAYSVMSSNNAGAAADIKSKISSGVGFANYTAHCNYDGWGDPSVTNSDIPNFNNENEYPFMIGNCCLSFQFNQNDAFGEMVLYAQNEGAVNYIGASNNSMWDEDMYWGIGLTSLEISAANVPNHNYSNTGQGAYDGIMHEHGENFDQWFYTGGQIIYAGNLQVQASTSGQKLYYWEIYHNSGDPSLMPYMTQPEEMSISYTNPMLGATTLSVNCEPYTYVAISQAGELLDAKWSGSGSSVELNFSALTSDEVVIVATKQDRVPEINEFTPIAPNPPIADFEANPTVLLEGQTVSFTDLSQYASEWSWDFGDGGTSTEQHPEYIYHDAGVYTISLTVTNPLDSDEITKTDYITVNVNTNPPSSDFVADQTIIPLGTTVNFTDLSQNNPDEWEWSFEGGSPNSSITQNPSVAYNSAGTFTVEMTASNEYGIGNTEVKTDYITVTLPDYCAAGAASDDYEYIASVEIGSINNASTASTYSDFSELTTDVIPGGDTDFTVSLGNGYDSDMLIMYVDWNRDGDFDDADETVYSSETGQGPFTDVFSVPSTVIPGQVRLRIRLVETTNSPEYSACGYSDFGEVEDYSLTVIAPEVPPVAAFTALNTESCTGLIQFVDESSWAESWAWNFGDGESSNEQNPQHIYAENGTYTVSLLVTNDYGEDSHVITDFVTVSMPDSPTVTNGESCGAGEMTLEASADGTIEWYDAPVDGNLIQTGNSLTDMFDATTNFYVSNVIPAEMVSGGKIDNTGEGGSFGNPDYVHGLIFDVYQPIKLNSVKVYATGTKERTINLKNSLGTTLESRTMLVADGESRIDLNMEIPVGTNYLIECDGDADLFRNGGQTAPILDFPYEITDVLSIHSNTADNLAYYYYFYDWEVEVGEDCSSPRIEVSAIVHDLPEIDLGLDQTICENDELVLDAGEGFTEYNWSDLSHESSITVTQAGIYSVTVVDENECEASDEVEIFVDALPDVTINPVNDLCMNDDPVTLTAATDGGVWNGTGVDSGLFYPEIAGVGTHAITYVLINGVCTATDEIEIVVHEAPIADINPVPALCLDAEPYVLSAVNEGGVWSGDGVTDGVFYASDVGVGTYTVSYELSNGICSDLDEIEIIVADSFDATISQVEEICENDAQIELVAANFGGTWTGVGVVDNQYFDPSIAGEGNHLISYSIGLGSCMDSDEILISVLEAPDATIIHPGNQCLNNDNITLTAENIGGVWEGDGVSGNQFNPSEAGIGMHTITYTIDNGACSDTDEIEILVGDNPQIDVSVTNASGATIADGSASIEISGGISPYTIYWSTGDEDEMIENVPPGTYSVVVTDVAGCMSSVPVVVDFANSIDGKETEFRIYPNPASEIIVVETDARIMANIQLINMLGQVIFEIIPESEKTILDISEYKNGLYIIRLNDKGGNSFTQAIIIE